jgi:hypothetical protein
MKNKNCCCSICGFQLDDNHYFPTTFPGIDQEICCNCDENLSLMFTNFEKKPGNNDGYIVPDNSDRIEQVTGRSYLENRLIYFQYVLAKRAEEEKPKSEVIKDLKDEISKITRAITQDNG